MSSGYFVQIGATRDGLDPYLDAARRRGMVAVLLETPDYLRWRTALGQRDFDINLPVQHIASPDAIVAAVASLNRKPELMLAGFEQHVRAAFAASMILGVRPTTDPDVFVVPSKTDQRRALTAAGLDVFQPRYRLVESLGNVADACDELGFPAVLKPSNGSSGLGVFLVVDKGGVADALTAASDLRNYDGGHFSDWLVEEYSVGEEVSVQALAVEGRAEILTYSEKFIRLESRPDQPGLATFWEGGHVVSPHTDADADVSRLASECIAAVGYVNGPFHLDLVRREDGARVLEMGFRLSGLGLASVVERVAAIDWAEAVFRVHLRDAPPLARPPGTAGNRSFGGQIGLRNTTELRIAEALRLRYGHEMVEVRNFPAPTYPEAWKGTAPPDMKADLRRHASTVGRVFVFHDQKATVSNLLSRCIASELRSP